MRSEMSKVCEAVQGLKPPILMVVVQIVFAGANILYKLAASDGMNLKIMVAYRLIFASASMIPLAIFFERKRMAKLTWTVVYQAFLCGLFGASLSQNLYIQSLVLTSATFATAIFNLVPGITFILALLFRLENLNFGSVSGKTKVAGTLLGMGGAMLLTFYKGVEINIWSTNVDLLHQSGHGGSHVLSSKEESRNNHLLGLSLAICSCLSSAVWIILQAKLTENYPCHYSSVALMSMMGSIQATAYALATENNWSEWRLGWNIRLLTVAFAGIGGSGLMFVVIAWCVHARGPLYMSVFSPLLLVFVAIVASLILNEKLTLGSVVGGLMIICGLNIFLWGKSKEIKRTMPSRSFKEDESVEINILTSSMANHDSVDDDVVPS